MARVLTNENNYYDIAATIRQMKNVNTTYKPREMASALKDIYSNEIEGTLPLTFESNGMPLIDYRIDGASGGVGDRTNNLFDLKKAVKKKYINSNGNEATSLSPAQENTLNHSDYVSIDSNVNYTFTCNTSQNYSLANTIALCWFDENKNILSRNTMDVRGNINNYSITALSPSNAKYLIVNFIAYVDDAVFYLNEGTTTVFEPYGYKIPVVANGKNLLNTKLSTIQLGAGITFQKNNDGTVVVNGTPSSNFSLLAFPVYLTTARYVLSGCPESQDSTKLRCDLRNSQYATVGGFDIGNGVIISVNSPGNYFFGIRVGAGYNCNNLKFYPMIRLATIEDDTYEPYIEPTTTNIYLDNPIRTVEDEVEYIDYSEQKQHRVRKNLLQNTATSQTINGVTFTVNNDGSVTCNGTSSATTTFAISITLNSNINYVLSGSPKNGGIETYRLDLRNISYSVYNNTADNGDGINFTVEENGTYLVCIRIAANYTCNNLTFYPMIRLASIQDDTYEPYIENTEVDVTLPAIPTIDGTNVLTIDTTVQPSNVYIQARKDPDEIVNLIEFMEEEI